MKIRAVTANNRKKAFEVTTSDRRTLAYPYARLEQAPGQGDPLKDVFVDAELAKEGFTYHLASGYEGTVHLDEVLDYNRDPDYLRDLTIYDLTIRARDKVERSDLSKREIIRRLGTSATQFYRLLDPTNYKKSIGQLISLLEILDCEVELVVRETNEETRFLPGRSADIGEFRLPTGEKYAIMALEFREDLAIDAISEVAPDLWISRGLPFPLPTHWTTWMGTLRAEQVASANLCIIAHAPSQTLHSLDEDNRRLVRRLDESFFGLLFASPGTPRLSGNYFSGAVHADETDVREMGTVETCTRTPGAPFWALDNAVLDFANEITQGIVEFQHLAETSRTWRMTTAFHDGAKSGVLGDRLHQFIRCIEGAILPEAGRTERQFKSRSELFIGPAHHTLVEQLYRLRSAVEHLHDPNDFVKDRKELARFAYQSEAIARHCLQRIFTRRHLHRVFDTDEHLESFWNLGLENRQHEWGESLDIDGVAGEFDKRAVI